MANATGMKKSDSTGHIDSGQPAKNCVPRTIRRPRMLLSPSLAMAGVTARTAFLGGLKLPDAIAKPPEKKPGRIGPTTEWRNEKAKKIAATPRLGPLKVRKKLLAAKCRAAGVKTPMALALAKRRVQPGSVASRPAAGLGF